MKKSTKAVIFIFTFIIFSCALSYGQVSTFSIHRKITLKSESQSKEIEIECKETCDYFTINIKSTVYKGNLNIELINPSGKKQEDFEIKGHVPIEQTGINPTKMEENMVNGVIRKEIRNPLKGNWIVKIVPEKLTGEIIIESTRQQLTSTNKE